MTIDDHLATVVESAVRRAVADVVAEHAKPLPLVLAADEAASLLAVSRRTVESWVADGVLPRMPSTGRLLIPRAAIEAWVERAANPPITIVEGLA